MNNEKKNNEKKNMEYLSTDDAQNWENWKNRATELAKKHSPFNVHYDTENQQDIINFIVKLARQYSYEVTTKQTAKTKWSELTPIN
jgi:hypothetical protein